jgi:hypothetical protein
VVKSIEAAGHSEAFLEDLLYCINGVCLSLLAEINVSPLADPQESANLELSRTEGGL